MLFDGGTVRHMIDFTEYEVGAGDLLWIRPGQVHRFIASHTRPSTAGPSSPCNRAFCPARPSSW